MHRPKHKKQMKTNTLILVLLLSLIPFTDKASNVSNTKEDNRDLPILKKSIIINNKLEVYYCDGQVVVTTNLETGEEEMFALDVINGEEKLPILLANGTYLISVQSLNNSCSTIVSLQ